MLDTKALRKMEPGESLSDNGLRQLLDAYDALAELVACKQLSDNIDDQMDEPIGNDDISLDNVIAELERREPLAWTAARKAMGNAA